MADQNISFVMLERDGSTLLSTGPVALSDTRLRRAQACAEHSPVSVEIVRELIRLKLTGQEKVLRSKAEGNVAEVNQITECIDRLPTATTVNAIRQLEAKAASIYWSALQDVAVRFPSNEFLNVPEHWKILGARRSPLSWNARKATNPINAILNYLYAVLESETRLAINALGLDPGFGLLHVDAATRDSLVYDLMEPIRPKVDEYVLDWIARTPLKRSLFFESHDGTCRLMATLTTQLSQTAIAWSREIAPIVEWFAQQLCSGMLEETNVRGPGTRLTQRRRRERGDSSVHPPTEAVPPQENLCKTCGKAISLNTQYCNGCGAEASTRAMLVAHEKSRSPEALKKRAEKMLLQREAQRLWSPTDLPNWLTEEVYLLRIQPLLRNIGRTKIEAGLNVSPPYARNIATGKTVPHWRHWIALARMTGMTIETTRGN